jgi:hypothetical protein
MLQTKHNVSHNGVHTSLVAAARFLPGRDKDLSAPPRINNKTFRTWRTQQRIYKSKCLNYQVTYSVD